MSDLRRYGSTTPRQPSTRPAEPRTFADAPQAVQRCVTHHACPCHEWMAEQWRQAEAAAPAGLDVEALALVFAGITFSEWADAQGDTTRLFDLTRHVAAEYARLLHGQPTEDER